MSRVLVVDDEAVVCELLGYVLQAEGRQITYASSALEALECARRMAPIAVALVDKNLPDGSGLDLTHRLKAMDPMTEIILMTAYPSLDSVLEAVEAGACDYLPKPFDDVQQVAIRVKSAEEQSALRRQQQELLNALRESEERYRTLFASSPDPLLVVDDETGAIQDANGAALKLYGYARSDLVGRSITILRPADGVWGASDATVRSAKDEFAATSPSQQRDVRADGDQVDVEVASSHFQLHGRRMVAHVMRDVRERIRAAEEKSRLEAQLRHAQKMEALGQLAGGIAHDFNNLLAVIINYAGFVNQALRELPTTPDSQGALEDVEQILQAGASAASVTRQLLAFSRKEVVKPEALDINGVVTEFEKILRRTIGQNVRLETRLAAATRPVKMDRGQLEQVIMNLVVNARDAMHSGGLITIATESHSPGQPGAIIAHERGTVVLQVTDTGAGMTAQTLDKIFDPFFTTKGRGAGTGLGLATVRGIVEQFDGSIDVFSRQGRGSTFRISLPACEEEVLTPISAPPMSTSLMRGTILVVEDDDAFRRGVQRILARIGCEVLEARGGAEAIAIYDKQAGAVDMLITDLVMPGMSGEELAAQLRGRQPTLKVIYMTGYASKSVDALPGDQSEAAVLPKPFREGRLLVLVREMLRAQADAAKG